ncbi:hypothetical protein M3Y98_00992300 [Aphelenchoides besseyi]|nr:hypothetical protein M3Y98_00992300 [Aphelenchoides besseyi]
MSVKKLQLNNPTELQTDWRSIYIATLLTFVGSVQFSLYFSAMWPYLSIIRTLPKAFFVYSLGQCISSPGFGWWSNKIKAVTPPLSCGLQLMLVGNILYLMMEFVEWIAPRYLLLIGRLIIGFGSGNVAILRTYASTASAPKDNSKAIAYVTCGQALGLTTGPIFQLIFTPLAHPGYTILDYLTFHVYNSPAYLACLMNVVGLILLHFYFKETYAGIVEEEEDDAKNKSIESDLNSEKMERGSPVPMPHKQKLPDYDQIAVWVSYATRFADQFVRANLETLATAFAMMSFSYTEHLAVTRTSMAQGAVGAITFGVYIVYIIFDLDKHISNRIWCMMSLVILALFSCCYVRVAVSSRTRSSAASGGIGCNVTKYDWCEDLTTVNEYVFYSAYAIMIGIAFPILTITTNQLFSQILGPRRQAVEQGFLQVAAGVARMIGPVTAGHLYAWFGPRPVWWLEFVVCLIVLSLWFVFYSRMVPLHVPDELLVHAPETPTDFNPGSLSTLTSTALSTQENEKKLSA